MEFIFHLSFSRIANLFIFLLNTYTLNNVMLISLVAPITFRSNGLCMLNNVTSTQSSFQVGHGIYSQRRARGKINLTLSPKWNAASVFLQKQF